MNGRRRPGGTVLALALAMLMLVGGLAGFLLPSGHLPSSPGYATHPSGVPASAPTGANSPLAHLPTSALSGQPLVTQATLPSGAAGLPLWKVLPPNPNVNPTLSSKGLVVPTFSTVPAPMGISDLGVNAAGAYTYRTKGFEGTLAFQTFRAFEPGYEASPSYQAPDWAVVKLAAVAVNISYPHATSPTGVFWVENAVHLNGSRLKFEDNIWNFSAVSAGLPLSTLHGTAGKIYLARFYAGFGPSLAVTFPFTLDLYVNLTKGATHDVLYFNYTIINNLGARLPGTYDIVTFNGTASSASPPQFEVSGSGYTPAGLLYDSELVVGGNGGGAHTNLLDLSATAKLREWAHATSKFLPVRSAYDFGVDSSETASGIASHYVNKSGKPVPTVHLVQGPSMLYGLWNTSSATGVAPAAKSGWIGVNLSSSPDYAFLFANLSSATAYAYAPSGATGTMTTELPPPPTGAPYVFDAWADGYQPSANVPVSGNTTQTVSLTASPSILDAPVYLNGDTQAAALGAARVTGMGYAGSSPATLWLNASAVQLAAPFRSLNDESYPAFQLLVAQGLSTNVVVNGFEQSRFTFNYTSDLGTSRYLPGWTQGYFFFGGSGRFTVGNTSLEAAPSAVPQAVPTLPAPTVEFYFTHGSSAYQLSSSLDAHAVTAFGVSSLRLSNISAVSGGKAVVASNSTNLTITTVSADGQDPLFHPSVGITLTGVRRTSIVGLAASNLAEGLTSAGSTYLNLSSLSVASGATGVSATATGSANVVWMNVTGGVPSAAGNWTGSNELSFKHLGVRGTGLVLTNDLVVTMVNCSAQGPGSSVVQSFNGSKQGTFTGINASNSATGLNLTLASNLTVTDVVAQSQSLGVAVAGSTGATVTNVLAETNSLGVLWNLSSTGTISTVSAFVDSLGVWAENASGLTISGVKASNNSLDREAYFSIPGSLSSYPIAAVGLLHDNGITVTDVQATYYPFAVWANYTQGLTLTSVIGWYCGTVVSDFENATLGEAHSLISQVFSFGSRLGILLVNCEYVKVEASTLEASQGFGINISNGSSNNVTNTNFVANNNSSVTGGYSVSHAQAWTNRVTNHFYENYWADWPGIGRYPINNSVDIKPLTTGFYSFYLEFTESGLAGGQAWTFALGNYPAYTTTSSVVYIPGWTLSAGRLPFKVLAPVGVAANPRYGNVSWAGATLPPIHIVFGTPVHPLMILGVAAWLFLTVVGAVVAVVVGVFFYRRRGRRPPAPRTNPLDEPFP